MKKRLVIAAIALFAVTAIAVIIRLSNTGSNNALILSGNVEATEVNLGFKTPGRVAELSADEGRKVAKGDRLASLDSAELESIVAQGMASVRLAEAELEKAAKDYERAVVLSQSGAISAQQMDAAKRAHEAAASQLQHARAALAVTRERLKDATLFAPVSGVVLQRNVEPGETVGAGASVYTIGDLDNPWIRVYVKEDKLGLVKLGQKAEVRVDSYPKKAYEGTVTQISSEAEFTPKNVQTQEERVKLVFGVKVSVKNENDELKPGMPADVKILLK